MGRLFRPLSGLFLFGIFFFNVMKLRIFLAILAVMVIAGILAGIKALQIKGMIDAGQQSGPDPVSVATGEVQQGQWVQAVPSVGTFRAIEGTTIRSEAQGVVTEILFEAGSAVQKGEVLLKLDTDVQKAQLEAAVASRDLAEATLNRVRALHQRNNISDSELDNARATYDQAVANVANLQAVLRKRTIRAPFAGKLGIREISIGQFITPGQAIVSLQNIDRVYLDFDLPQNQLGFLSRDLAVEAVVDAFPDQSFTGTLTAISPTVATDTRALTLQATFQNPEELLRPGMFATVRLIRPEKRPVTFIPRRAVLNATYGDTVFVVQPPEEEGGFPTVRQQVVRMGETQGDFVEITEGLQGDETVVSAGAFKLKEGDAIKVSDRGILEPQLNPRPAEG